MRVTSLDFARSRYMKAFLGTLVGLDLRHESSPLKNKLPASAMKECWGQRAWRGPLRISRRALRNPRRLPTTPTAAAGCGTPLLVQEGIGGLSCHFFGPK